MTDPFIVIMGDVVGSRRNKRRKILRKQLNKTILLLNEEFENQLFAPFSLAKGDEISAVVEGQFLPETFEIMKTIQMQMYPHTIRIVFIVGELDLEVNSRNVLFMDGPAFWEASERIERMKRTGGLIHFSIEYEGLGDIISAALSMTYRLKLDWTEKEFEVINNYSQTKNQKITAEQFGVSQQSISDALRRSHWKYIVRVEESIQNMMYDFKLD
jgi:SatD family protein